MASEPDQAPRAQSLLTLGALAVMLSAAALAFGRVFKGEGATLRLVVAAVASAALATLLERRNLLIATIASGALLILAVGLLVWPSTTFWGLPTARTFAAIGDAIGRVREQARIQVSPTVPLPPLFLAAITAIWAAAFSAHALLGRAGSPILAMLPPVALVGFADTVLDDGGRPFFAVLFLLGVLTVILADGIRRMRQWGPVWPWHGRRGRKRVVPARGATRVAAVALGAAVLLPGLLPGFGAGPLIDLGSGSNSGHIDPFVSIQATLRETNPQALFSVASPVRAYWRMLSLDTFDPENQNWGTADPIALHGQAISTTAPLPGAEPVSPFPAEGGASGVSTSVKQTFTVLRELPAGEAWLPMAYAPQNISYPTAALRYDARLTTAIAPGIVPQGTQYTVTSRITSPTRGQLEVISSLATPEAARYSHLPQGTPSQLRDIALGIVNAAHATTPIDEVLAIWNYLRSPPFRYDKKVDYSNDPNAIVDFLTKGHAGFCQHYATAMALLVRELGLPARIAVGYRPGHPDPNRPGTYIVTSQEFHTWVEVLFPTYGWLPFEPTPEMTNPAAASYEVAPTASSCASGRSCTGGSAATGHQGIGLDPHDRGNNGLGAHQRKGRTLHGRGVSGPVGVVTNHRLPLGTLLRIGLLLGLAFLILTPPIRFATRFVRLRRAHGGRSRILAEYRAFIDRAADLGFPRAPGETIDEYRRRVASRVRLSDGHLGRLSSAAERAAYGTEETPEADVRALHADARVALKDVRRSVGLAQRIRGQYRPSL
jgi:transglutaminase-like putative cysteine protease